MTAGPLTQEQINTLRNQLGSPGPDSGINPTLQHAARLGMELAAQVCIEWGDNHDSKWQHDPEMWQHAKARAWTALQCAATIRERGAKR